MLFIIHALDKPDHLEHRKANQPAHVEYVKSRDVKLVLAGPIFAADGETMKGSLLIIDAPDMEAAEAFAADDPYNKAGLFERVDVNAWRKTVGWVD